MTDLANELRNTYPDPDEPIEKWPADWRAHVERIRKWQEAFWQLAETENKA
jgi:hypothetical protein